MRSIERLGLAIIAMLFGGIVVDHLPLKVWASSISAAAYNLVQNSGTPLTLRTTINCSTGMSCSDDSVNKVTTFTAVGSGGSVTSVVCGSTTITTTGTCVTNNQLVRSFGAGFDGGGSALTSGKTTYFTVPFGCTITGYNITVDTGTVSLDVWKVATGTAIPVVGNSILTGGFLRFQPAPHCIRPPLRCSPRRR